jgi:hypothetical protein
MEFKLPAHLQEAVASYDPVLKHIVEQQKKATVATKGKKTLAYPLGKVDFLIPEEFVSKEDQLQACQHINTQPANRRFHRFRFNDNEPLAIAVIYHYESVWYATWVPKTNDRCIYGYSYAYKDNATTRGKIDCLYKNEIESTEQVLVGRTTFLHRSFEVTKEYIKEHGPTSRAHHAYNSGALHERFKPYGFASYHNKSSYMRDVVHDVREMIVNKIPTWKRANACNTFELIYRDTAQEYALVTSHGFLTKDSRAFYFQYPFNTDGFICFIKDYYKKYAKRQLIDNNFYGTNFINIINAITNSTTDFISIIERPFFRRLITEAHSKATKAFDEKNDPRDVGAPFKEFGTLLRNMDEIFKIWHDCPIDYMQNHVHILCQVHLYSRMDSNSHAWLRNNMNPKTFFNMLNKSYESAPEHLIRTGTYAHLLLDSFSMLNSLLGSNVEVERPSRWRLVDFHDHLMVLCWKQNNENIKLPQDLFPQPINIKSDSGQRWTFIQPIDTHQLGSWGQAVRNCVGNSNYANGIKKKEHFIVLGMVDEKPIFTVQLKVNAGVLSVVQLAGIANASLTHEQRHEYEQMFSKALQVQAEQLVSG